MDPGTLLLAGTTYAAALVARKAADELADGFWARIKQALKKTLGREPQPTDVSGPILQEVAGEPGIREDLEALLGDSAVLRRAVLVERVIKGSRVLWVDDHPERNVWEHDCLTALGAMVKTVETTRSAAACLEREQYDLILSDVAREGSASAGLDALDQLHGVAPSVPVVLYVLNLQQGVPSGTFGITNRPDELLHLCMDAFERGRI